MSASEDADEGCSPWESTSVLPASTKGTGTSEPAPGDAAARFRDHRAVASGGMGTIYEAVDGHLQRRVAVKVLHPTLAASDDEIAAFVHEARITGQLDHPNIVPVHDLEVDDEKESAQFMMKLVQGETLEDQMRTLGDDALKARELERLLDIVIKVCDAVSFAHSRGVLHLDLKPDNVMVGSFGQVYVMDWGIAVQCTVHEGTLTPNARRRNPRGTISYMPPEQLNEYLKGVDQRADVYAIGGILHRLLTGKPTFVGEGAPTDVLDKREHEVPPLDQLTERPMPPGLRAIAEKALSRNKEDRYENVEALHDAIQDFLRGGGWLAVRHFEKGQVIVREGDVADSAYIITEGQCEVYKGDGVEQLHIGRMGEGEVFGEVAILSVGMRTANVVALTDVSALEVTREALDRELEGRVWLRGILQALASRFREADAERTRLSRQPVQP